MVDLEIGRPLSPIQEPMDKRPHPGGDGSPPKKNRLDKVEDDVSEIKSSTCMSSLLSQMSTFMQTVGGNRIHSIPKKLS